MPFSTITLLSAAAIANGSWKRVNVGGTRKYQFSIVGTATDTATFLIDHTNDESGTIFNVYSTTTVTGATATDRMVTQDGSPYIRCRCTAGTFTSARVTLTVFD